MPPAPERPESRGQSPGALQGGKGRGSERVLKFLYILASCFGYQLFSKLFHYNIIGHFQSHDGCYG